jgi:glycosyltransferase involved in cell wall biosynthesis
MKKTLVICDRYPLPDNIGTSIRTMNFVKYFKKHGSVDLAYSELPSGTEAGNTIFSNEYLLETKDYPYNFTGRLIEVLNGRPYPVHAYSQSSQKLLLSMIESNHYDYTLVRYATKAYCLFRLSIEQKKKIIIDFDDIFSGPIYGSLFKNTKNPFKKMKIHLNRQFLKIYEKKCLDFGATLLCSEKDISLINGKKNNIIVAPNVYSNKTFEDYDFGNGFKSANTLLFLGALLYGPNIEGLKWFIKSVFPGYQKAHSDYKLLVVGLSPTEEIRKLCLNSKGVELYANVPDVKGYYEQCKAVVVPLLSGGGTRIKILEGALASRPVLSTPVGAEGLDLVDGRDILLFRNAEEFSHKINEIHDERKYHSLVSSAKEFVLKNYSIKNFDEAMNEALHRIDGDE